MATTRTEPIQLWPGGAPGTGVAMSPEITGSGSLLGGPPAPIVRNVSVPTLTPYLPDPAVANGTAVVIAPGGGFQFLSWEAEGTAVAERLQALGVAAFVLKYRLADTGETDDDFSQAMAAWFLGLLDESGAVRPVTAHRISPGAELLAYADGRQAVRVVRERAAEWSLDPARIGFVGFSAGAFVATATAFSEDALERPDFVGLIYGGSPMGPVTDATPPMFCVVAQDDPLCLETCVATTEAWRQAGRPATLHVYDEGGHGFAGAAQQAPVTGWFDRLATGRDELGLLTG
jgi:acetyl esterase/lipase